MKDLAEGASGFPAVELYQVGDAYFAVDGHHRISVVRSWYETLFAPMTETIRASSILGDFAGRTEADLYLFTARHLHDLRQRWGDDVKPGRAVEHLRLKTRLQAKERPSVRSRARKQLEEPGEG